MIVKLIWFIAMLLSISDDAKNKLILKYPVYPYFYDSKHGLKLIKYQYVKLCAIAS